MSAAALTAAVVAVFALAGLLATVTTEDSPPTTGAWPPPSLPEAAPVAPAPDAIPDEGPPAAPPTPYPSDDKGFIDSSARCQDPQSAYAIGRTNGSLVVICGERTGPYEYLGVRLSDAAVLRTDAESASARGFLAQRAGVVYAVSPTELRVTAGDAVIKQEPMIEYREVPRQ